MVQNIELVIETLGAQGDGIAHYNGKAVYIDGVLAGETVLASLQHDRKPDHYRAQLRSVVEPSVDRAIPPCRHFSKCGGCRLQHMNDNAYHQWKIGGVTNYLLSKGVKPKQWGDPVFVPARTRRRTTLSCIRQGDTLIVGFHQLKGNDIINLKECHLLTPELEALVPQIKSALDAVVLKGQKFTIFMQQADNGVDVVITGTIGRKDEPDLQVIEAVTDMARSTDIIRVSWRANEKQTPQTMIELVKPYVTFGELQIPLAPLAFLQPSREGEGALCALVESYMPQAGGRTLNAVDLFSGCGTFTGVLQCVCKGVDAYEADQGAIAQLKSSGHVRSFVRDLFRDPLNERELAAYDVAVIDPPRAGALEQSKMLANSDVKTIIAVSCNPATFARDALVLIEEGYSMEKLTIVDQFIWSAHAEIVAQFILK